MHLSTEQKNAILTACGCVSITHSSTMQSLWAEQGELTRLTLLAKSQEGVQENQPASKSIVVKYIAFNDSAKHPHGWHGLSSQQRKRHSYHVELNWYKNYVCEGTATVEMTPAMAKLIYVHQDEKHIVLALEDLSVNYPVHFTQGQADRPSTQQINACLHWLATLHARHFQQSSEDLWSIGSYWHLETRQDEFNAMPASALKSAASTFDDFLNTCPYQTIIHGDAKLANFCFNSQGDRASAVDFQYAGQGVGIKDVMLLLSSVLPDADLLKQADCFIGYYFKQLDTALAHWQPQVNSQQVIKAWRALYPIAWADFHRFLVGWKPNHWKIAAYCLQQTEQALIALKQSTSKLSL